MSKLDLDVASLFGKDNIFSFTFAHAEMLFIFVIVNTQWKHLNLILIVLLACIVLAQSIQNICA